MIYTVANLPQDNRAHALLRILFTHLLLAGMCNHRGPQAREPALLGVLPKQFSWRSALIKKKRF
jgi:hypothetical protein